MFRCPCAFYDVYPETGQAGDDDCDDDFDGAFYGGQREGQISSMWVRVVFSL